MAYLSPYKKRKRERHRIHGNKKFAVSANLGACQAVVFVEEADRCRAKMRYGTLATATRRCPVSLRAQEPYHSPICQGWHLRTIRSS